MRARRIRSVVKKLKINQSDLARDAGIDRSVLNKFLHCRCTVTDVQLSEIEAAVRSIASAQLERVLEALKPAAA